MFSFISPTQIKISLDSSFVFPKTRNPQENKEKSFICPSKEDLLKTQPKYISRNTTAVTLVKCLLNYVGL